MNQAGSSDAMRIYNVDRWGDGYFSVDSDGFVTVKPCGNSDGPHARLDDVLQACRQAGLRSPVLVRFAGILRHRVKVLAGAFRHAITEQAYGGH